MARHDEALERSDNTPTDEEYYATLQRLREIEERERLANEKAGASLANAARDNYKDPNSLDAKIEVTTQDGKLGYVNTETGTFVAFNIEKPKEKSWFDNAIDGTKKFFSDPVGTLQQTLLSAAQSDNSLVRGIVGALVGPEAINALTEEDDEAKRITIGRSNLLNLPGSYSGSLTLANSNSYTAYRSVNLPYKPNSNEPMTLSNFNVGRLTEIPLFTDPSSPFNNPMIRFAVDFVSAFGSEQVAQTASLLDPQGAKEAAWQTVSAIQNPKKTLQATFQKAAAFAQAISEDPNILMRAHYGDPLMQGHPGITFGRFGFDVAMLFAPIGIEAQLAKETSLSGTGIRTATVASAEYQLAEKQTLQFTNALQIQKVSDAGMSQQFVNKYASSLLAGDTKALQVLDNLVENRAALPSAKMQNALVAQNETQNQIVQKREVFWNKLVEQRGGLPSQQMQDALDGQNIFSSITKRISKFDNVSISSDEIFKFIRQEYQTTHPDMSLLEKENPIDGVKYANVEKTGYSINLQNATLQTMEDDSIAALRPRPKDAYLYDGVVAQKPQTVYDDLILYKDIDGRRIILNVDKQGKPIVNTSDNSLLAQVVSDTDVADYLVNGKSVDNASFINEKGGFRVDHNTNYDGVNTVNHGPTTQGLQREDVVHKLGGYNPETQTYSPPQRIQSFFNENVTVFQKAEGFQGYVGDMSYLDFLKNHNRHELQIIRESLTKFGYPPEFIP